MAIENFTVIGYNESTGKTFMAHVEAEDHSASFAVAAESHPDGMFLTAHKGHLKPGEDFDFAGESVVDADTVLEQDDVFGCSP